MRTGGVGSADFVFKKCNETRGEVMDRNLINLIIRWRIARVAKDAKDARVGRCDIWVNMSRLEV